jgi:hypothetical protein
LFLQRPSLCLKGLLLTLDVLFFYLDVRDGDGQFFVLDEDGVEPACEQTALGKQGVALSDESTLLLLQGIVLALDVREVVLQAQNLGESLQAFLLLGLEDSQLG